MPNTINKEAVLSAKIATILQEPTAFEVFANTDYEKDLNEQGDEVVVQNFPILEWNVKTGDVQKIGGNKIPVTSWELGKSRIRVNYVANINIEIKNIEKAISNLNLEKGLEYEMAQGGKRVRSRFIRDLALEKAGNIIGTETKPLIVTKENSLDVVVDMTVALDNNDIPSLGRALFARPDLCGKLRLAEGFDGTSIGAEMRKLGAIGEVDGFIIIKDTTLPKGKALAMDKNSVHFISKLSELKTVGSDKNNEGFFGNTLGEQIYGGDVLENNKKRICVLNYSTTPGEEQKNP